MAHVFSVSIPHPSGFGWVNVPGAFPGQLDFDPDHPKTFTDEHYDRAKMRAWQLIRSGVVYPVWEHIEDAVQAAMDLSRTGGEIEEETPEGGRLPTLMEALAPERFEPRFSAGAVSRLLHGLGEPGALPDIQRREDLPIAQDIEPISAQAERFGLLRQRPGEFLPLQMVMPGASRTLLRQFGGEVGFTGAPGAEAIGEGVPRTLVPPVSRPLTTEEQDALEAEQRAGLARLPSIGTAPAARRPTPRRRLPVKSLALP